MLARLPRPVRLSKADAPAWVSRSRGWPRTRRKSTSPFALMGVLAVAVLLLGAVTVRMFELQGAVDQSESEFSSFGNALWWSLSTILTVGYGDIVPRTPLGRLAAGLVMLAGVLAISGFTASFASLLTAQRLREARGLQQIRSRGHVVICGFNAHLESILADFARLRVHERGEIVLLNDWTEDDMEQLALRYESLGPRFVKGDFVQEAALRRANVQQAEAVVILSGESALDGSSDQRTLLATLAIKNLRPETKVCAQVNDPANASHLRIARADEVIVNGEHTGFLLASAAIAPGIPQVVRSLMAPQGGSPITRATVPRDFVGRTFGDLAQHFRRERQAILIGLISEREGVSIQEMLAGGSPIDAFIEQKFREAGRNLELESRRLPEILINPPDEQEILPHDDAVIIDRAQVPA